MTGEWGIGGEDDESDQGIRSCDRCSFDTRT